MLQEDMQRSHRNLDAFIVHSPSHIFLVNPLPPAPTSPSPFVRPPSAKANVLRDRATTTSIWTLTMATNGDDDHEDGDDDDDEGDDDEAGDGDDDGDEGDDDGTAPSSGAIIDIDCCIKHIQSTWQTILCPYFFYNMDMASVPPASS